MKRRTIWRILLVLGAVPFAAPFLVFVYQMLVSPSWRLFDWLIFWSVIYWPSYLIGIILIGVSVWKLRKQ